MMTKAGIKTVTDLMEFGLLPDDAHAHLKAVGERYAISIPPHLRQQMASQPSNGPLARQFVPDVRELQTRRGDLVDPIGDRAHSPVKGLVHRYPDRVLLKIVHVCPVYCRFCFRREMVGPGPQATLTEAEVANALDYVARTPGISEVILTGGDPLVLSPRRIQDLTHAIALVPHVKKLRWHSRVPVATPERVTGELVAALKAAKLPVRLAVHTNHVDELTREARKACRQLQEAGIELLSQSVLLRGVNDTIGALTDLFEAFRALGIRPYYLHQLDLAPGTHHFRVPIRDGQTLLRTVQQHAPDLVQPRYILDIPGGFGKVPIAPSHVRPVAHNPECDFYRVRDPFDRVHIYRDVIYREVGTEKTAP